MCIFKGRTNIALKWLREILTDLVFVEILVPSLHQGLLIPSSPRPLGDAYRGTPPPAPSGHGRAWRRAWRGAEGPRAAEGHGTGRGAPNRGVLGESSGTDGEKVSVLGGFRGLGGGGSVIWMSCGVVERAQKC